VTRFVECDSERAARDGYAAVADQLVTLQPESMRQTQSKQPEFCLGNSDRAEALFLDVFGEQQSEILKTLRQ
jgi:hypothetical protein